jgi:hypothetical protein
MIHSHTKVEHAVEERKHLAQHAEEDGRSPIPARLPPAFHLPAALAVFPKDERPAVLEAVFPFGIDVVGSFRGRKGGKKGAGLPRDLGPDRDGTGLDHGIADRDRFSQAGQEAFSSLLTALHDHPVYPL